MIYSVRHLLVSTVKESFFILVTLFKILIPMVILVKVLDMLGLVTLLGKMLAPLMVLTGLPGEMGLVWASALLTNNYGGIIVFVSLAGKIQLTAAQATVLTAMMLMAHAIPIEVQIAKKAGTRFAAMAAFRIGAALVFGMLLNFIYSYGGWLQEPAKILMKPSPVDASILGWAVGEIQHLAYIACIVTALVLTLKVLKIIGVIRLINAAFEPLMKLMGIGKEATSLTMVGFTLGLAYGGGLIINEARSGAISHRDVFFSLAFMGICHSMIEDTLLMVAIGGHLSGILWLRTIFSILIIAVSVRLFAKVSDIQFYRFLFLNQKA
jgi:spore maturation protein SpmB